MIYQGKCHCGKVRFSFTTDPIERAIRCNCSICRRKDAIMSDRYYAPDEFRLESGSAALTLYRFGDEMVNHWFCKHCGIYPFHDGPQSPGRYRVNLGCVDALDLDKLSIRTFDGKDSWRLLD